MSCELEERTRKYMYLVMQATPYTNKLLLLQARDSSTTNANNRYACATIFSQAVESASVSLRLVASQICTDLIDVDAV